MTSTDYRCVVRRYGQADVSIDVMTIERAISIRNALQKIMVGYGFFVIQKITRDDVLIGVNPTIETVDVSILDRPDTVYYGDNCLLIVQYYLDRNIGAYSTFFKEYDEYGCTSNVVEIADELWFNAVANLELSLDSCGQKFHEVVIDKLNVRRPLSLEFSIENFVANPLQICVINRTGIVHQKKCNYKDA